MITIEKNVPIPPRGGRKARPPKYPFADMVVGDSFFVEADQEQAPKKSASIGLSWRKHANIEGAKFTTRIVDGGVRCWRTE